MVSNTNTSSANQTIFYPENEDMACVGRVFYKVFCGGKYKYSITFSSVTDSSYPNINFTKRNVEVLEWEILEARIGLVKNCDLENMPTVSSFKQLYFEGKKNKKICQAGLFSTDEFELDVEDGEYVCLEVVYKGKAIPHHHEYSTPSFKKVGEAWIPSDEAIYAQTIGCDRAVEKKIAFIGDSLTQGNRNYKNWTTLLGERLGTRYAFWNLGIGYSTANDCATDKLWLSKAKQNDVVFVCFGVNDINLIYDEERTKADLSKIVALLNEAGCKVILQTLPPFNFKESKLLIWNNLNAYIKEELSQKAYAVFDVAPFLANGDVKDGVAKYGAHPDADGCKLWAEKLFEFVKKNHLI